MVNNNELFYIGETGRNLRSRLGALRCNTMKSLVPYNDPHTAAPSLWAWHHAEGFDFECSVAPVTLADDPNEARKRRKGLESYLLELLYVGESNNLCDRLRKLAEKEWGSYRPHFSYVQFPDDAPYQKHEIENDLLGGLYALTKRAPQFQHINNH